MGTPALARKQRECRSLGVVILQALWHKSHGMNFEDTCYRVFVIFRCSLPFVPSCLGANTIRGRSSVGQFHKIVHDATAIKYYFDALAAESPSSSLRWLSKDVDLRASLCHRRRPWPGIGFAPARDCRFLRRACRHEIPGPRGRRAVRVVFQYSGKRALPRRNSPRYVGGILVMLNARLFKYWHDLPEALRTGKPQNEIKHGHKGNVRGAL